MADLSKLKRRSTLGAPPPPTEASNNLESAEIAVTAPPHMQPAAERIAAAIPSPPDQGRRVRDGRSARRTGRTVQFATRVTPDFDEQFRAIAERDRLLHVELLEKALSAYERSRHLGQG
jgi:hypothetical protein